MKARQASLDGQRVRQHVSYVLEAQTAVTHAMERHDDLVASLAAKRTMLEVHRKDAMQHGKVHPAMRDLTYAIEDLLPGMIHHAAAEIEAARKRLSDTEKRRDEAFAAHAQRVADGEIE